MPKAALTLRLVSALCALTAVSTSTAHAASTEKQSLPNGLTLISRTLPNAHTAAVALFVRAGSLDETDCPAGTNYILANMLVEDAAHPRALDFPALKAGLGGGLTVTAAEEYTLFSCVCMRDQVDDAVNLLSGIVTPPRIRPSDLQRQKELAVGELKARDAFDLARAAAMAALFPGTRLAVPVPGTPDSIRQIREEHLDKLFAERYSANNMVLVVISGLPHSRVAQAVQSAFRKVRPGPVRSRPAVPPKPPGDLSPVVLERPVPVGAVMVACRTPGIMDPRYPALAVANAVLGGGKASRLFTELRERQGIGYEVGTTLAVFGSAGCLMGYALTDTMVQTPSGQRTSILEKVRETIASQLSRLARGELSDAELSRARRYVIGSYALKHERTADQAFLLGWWETCGGWDEDERFAQKVEKVGKEDVLRLAKEYFDLQAAVAVLAESSPSNPEHQRDTSTSGAARLDHNTVGLYHDRAKACPSPTRPGTRLCRGDTLTGRRGQLVEQIYKQQRPI